MSQIPQLDTRGVNNRLIKSSQLSWVEVIYLFINSRCVIYFCEHNFYVKKVHKYIVMEKNNKQQVPIVVYLLFIVYFYSQ